MKFTEHQQRAIDERGQNLLVSAAAGSGKTAVLVERIIQRITEPAGDGREALDIDRILVMTFTSAAAAEMRDRIFRAINDLLKQPERRGDQHLLRQATLVHGAHISTIHSFCLDVIRNHFHVIDLCPDFRPMEEAEGRLLMADTLDEVLEEAYENASPAFLAMTEHIAPQKSDAQFAAAVMRLYGFAVSNPDVDAWLDLCVRNYRDYDAMQPEKSPVIEEFLNLCRNKVRGYIRLAERALELTEEEGGPKPYGKALEEDLAMLERLADADGYADFAERLGAVVFSRLATASEKKGYDKELIAQVKTLRNKYKDDLTKRVAAHFAYSAEAVAENICAAAPDVEELVKITCAFYHRFQENKRRKNLIDYNDMEHYCLQILQSSEAIAREYREFFREIYVDEYQDSNLVQDSIVNIIADNNVFLVGDVKQSIYRFRKARPELFVRKYEAYAENDGGSKIDLHDNFRSRPQVLNAVNAVFRKVMQKDVGGIEYDDAAALNFGARFYPEDETKHYQAELLFGIKEPELDAKEQEALMVAARIRELILQELPVYDKSLPYERAEEKMRPLRYSDIVILLRGVRSDGEVFLKVLKEQGIPVHTDSSVGYFSAVEVAALLSYLSVIDNPLQDIPLAAVLRSPLGGFTDEELAIVSGSNREKLLYYRLCDISTETVNNKSTDVIKKSQAFLKQLEKHRERAAYETVYDILREIIDGAYGREISAMQNGRRRLANLNMLLTHALAFGKTSYRGLFQFVRYMQYLEKNEIDYGEANLLNENDNTVRIMTIHKSKGLEFPVVFVSALHKKINQTDASEVVIHDADYGIGITAVDSEKRTKRPTLIRAAIAERQRLENIAEEERLLYVAMTRAREKLILTGMTKDADSLSTKEVLMDSAGSYADMLSYAGAFQDQTHFEIRFVDAAELTVQAVERQVREDDLRLGLLMELQRKEQPRSAELSNRLHFRYAANEQDHYAKVTVTELKKRSMRAQAADATEDAPDALQLIEEEIVLPYIPAFMQTEETEHLPTMHGSAFHRMLELWDYRNAPDASAVDRFYRELRESRRMEENLIPHVRSDEIESFLKTELAARMGRAAREGGLYREQPFVVRLDNGMLLQGIIDAFFIEEDRIIVVDYKTDRVKSVQELIDRYRLQLDYYGMALQQLMELPVSEKIIYSSRLGRSIRL